MLPCHLYQRAKVEHFGGLVLNIACKEDPACLGEDFGAINCDLHDFDPQEKLSLYEVKNFVVGDALDLPFGDASFDTLVLGEFLEHCPFEAARTSLLECKRVMIPSGRIIVTVPLDGRPPEQQHAPHLLSTWKHGITSWHQTVWVDDLFEKLVGSVSLSEVSEHRQELNYGFCRGFGTVLQLQKNLD
jgi:SAM-dependent methyltransferase